MDDVLRKLIREIAKDTVDAYKLSGGPNTVGDGGGSSSPVTEDDPVEESDTLSVTAKDRRDYNVRKLSLWDDV